MNEQKTIELSEDQKGALMEIQDWITSGLTSEMTLGGYAGTGKSTLVQRIVSWCESIDIAVIVCAYTGKAAHVLRTKGIDDARTLHSVLYRPKQKCLNCGVFVNDIEDAPETCGTPQTDLYGKPVDKPHHWRTRFSRVQSLDASLVIVDEASMLSTGLVEDLRFHGIKVLYVGDHGQLEPIGENPGLMADPQLRLENIHRQASKSAIIRFAHAVRRGERPSRWVGYAHETEDGVEDLRILQGKPPEVSSYDIVLCGYNRTRCNINAQAREERGFSGDIPNEGEWVICLQNNREYGVFNGQRFLVKWCREDCGRFVMNLVSESGVVYTELPCYTDTFGQARQDRDARRTEVVLDWGYAITVHKAQGSEWDRVAVVEEMARSWTESRWRYTAITRASRTLHYYT